jgi:NAD(P)-dependent dehydrogenase (short-subunit alcohol dehydrogenase family)
MTGEQANALTHAFLIARDQARKNNVTLNVIGPGPVPEIESLEIAVEQCKHGTAWQERETASLQDIAESVAFLCSEAGSYISGAVLPFRYH